MAKRREKVSSPQRTAGDSAALQAPRFAFAWASLVYAICTLALGYPALAGKFLVNPHSDQYIAGYGFREFAAATLRATGHFPLWDPYLFGGMPYVAAMHGDIFYPTFLLRMMMPTDAAMTWGFIIHLFLAGLFTYGFLRALDYSFIGALIGGIAYMMSGQIASYVSPGHDGKLFVSALFPLALWILYRGFRGGRRWTWGALALVVGLAVISPHPQLLQYMLLTCGAYSLFLALATIDGVKLQRDEAIRRLGLALLAVLIGLAIGAVQYLPVREYVPWSPRAVGIGYERATSYAWPPIEVFNVYLPQFSGMLNNYWGRNGIHLHSDYAGVVVLILAGAALYGFRGDPRRKHLIFWGAALIISLLWSLGAATPFYHIPYAIVPGTKFFRAPATIFFVGTFSLALFACAGAERVLQLRVSRRYLLGWGIFGGLIVVLAMVGGLTNIAQTFADERAIDRVQANNSALIGGAFRSFLFVLATTALGIALLRGGVPKQFAAWALAALVVVDLWSIERIYWMFSPPASQIYASNAIVETIKADSQPGRVIAFPVQQTRQPDAYLSGDALMTHRIRNVIGYHGNQLGRYDDLIGTYADDNRLFSPNVLALTNTRFLLTNIPDLPFIGNTKLAKGPIRDAAGTDLYLYRLTSDNPYAWVTPVAVKAPDDQVLSTILNPRFDVKRAALFDTSAKVATAAGIQALPAPLAIKAATTSYAPGRVEIELSEAAPPGASLMVSENYYPGWTATVDGKPARLGRADYTLIGVELPAGARKVSLAFTSPAYEKGKVITWLAFVLAFVMLGVGVWRDRRSIA